MNAQADVARKAADYIEAHGLWKGALYDYRKARSMTAALDAGLPCCVIGALLGTDMDEGPGIRDDMNEWLFDREGHEIPEFNDADSTTAADAARVLREYADSIDPGEGCRRDGCTGHVESLDHDGLCAPDFHNDPNED